VKDCFEVIDIKIQSSGNDLYKAFGLIKKVVVGFGLCMENCEKMSVNCNHILHIENCSSTGR